MLTRGSYYNEFDKQKAVWLRELIKKHVIAPDTEYTLSGKWRPVEPGSFPLVDGPTGTVGQGGARQLYEMKIKGYGDAINAQVAKEFILVVKSILKEKTK